MNNISKATVIAAVAIMVAVFAVPIMSGDADAATDVWDGTTDTSWYDETSEKTSYEITTAEQLAGLAELVNDGNTFKGVTITLGTDLDLSGDSWIPIGFSGRVSPTESLNNIMRFEGNFDGDGHTITGLTSSGYVVESDDSCIVKKAYTYGLFGFVIDATVSNITLADVNIDLGSAGDISCDTAGAAVGYALGTTSLSNIKVSGSVTATDATGGVIGRFYGGQITITGCQSTADVKSTETKEGKAGGIIGILGLENTSSISGCTISGEISATYAGGMIGLANSTSGTHKFSDITVSDSTITGNLYSGGVVGRGAIGVSLSDCTVINSKISAVGDSLVEYNPKISYNAGGLMGGQGGEGTSIAIEDSTVTSCIVTSIQYAGGFIGSTLGSPVTISGGSVSNTDVSAVNKSGWDNLTTAAGVVGSISSGKETTQTVLIENVSLGSDITLESSNSDYFANSTFYGPMEGAAISFLGGHGTFEIKGMSDFGNYELIAQASFYSKGSDDEGITDDSTITISDCDTQNIMEWSVQGYRYKVFVKDGSSLEGFRSNTQTIMLSMDGTSSINQLIAGADEKLAQTMENKYFIDDKEYENTYVTGQFMVMSDQTVTVDSVTIMEPHTQKENAEGKMIRQYLGKIVGEDRTSCLTVLAGNANQQKGTYGLETGTYVWEESEKKWVQAIATVTDSDGNSLSYTTLSAAVSAASKGSTITILDDITESITIPSDSDIVLDLKGFTFTNTTGNNTITNYGTLTLVDSSSESSGKLTVSSDNNNAVYNTGTFTLDSGLITREHSESPTPGYVIDSTGALNINGGSVIADSGGSSLIRSMGTSSKQASMTITGGTVTQESGDIAVKNDEDSTLNITGGTIVCEGGISVQNWCAATIEGGTFEGAAYSITYSGIESSTMNISGGTFNGQVTSWNMTYNGVAATNPPEITITGGEFHGSIRTIAGPQGDISDVTENTTASVQISGGEFDRFDGTKQSHMLAEGYSMVGDSQTGFQPSYPEDQSVASIGDIFYASVEKALDAAKNGETITIISDDATISSDYDFKGDAILDLNNRTVTVTENGILNLRGGDLVVRNGELDLSAYSKLKIYSGTLKLEGCTVDCSLSGDGNTGGIIWLYGSTDPNATDYSVLDVGSDATITNSNSYSGGFYAICINAISNNCSYGVVVDFNGSIVGDDIRLSFYTNGTMNASDGNVPKITIGKNCTTTGGIYAAGFADWDIYGGQFTGSTALSIKSGIFDIYGGTFHATGSDATPPEPNNNGSEDTGAALSITTNKNYAQKTVVNVRSGTFISDNGYAVFEGIAKDAEGTASDQSSAEIKIAGGTFNGGIGDDIRLDATKNKDIVEGGTFSSDVSEFVADGFAVIPNGDDTYGTVTTETPAGVSINQNNRSITVDVVADSVTIPVVVVEGQSIEDVTVTVNFPKGTVTVKGTATDDVTVAFIILEELEGNDFAFNLSLDGITLGNTESVTITIPVDLGTNQRIESVTAYSVVNGEEQEENATVSGSSVIITTNHNTPFYVDWVLGTVPSQGGGSGDPSIDDDDSPLPPIIGPGGSGSSSSADDDTVTIVACAASAAVAAIMAVFLIVLYRKD